MTNEYKVVKYAIVIQPLSFSEGGGYEAYFPQLRRGVTGQGNSIASAIGNLFNHLDLFLDLMSETNQILPDPVSIDLFQ